ncbi:MAG: ABC transporter ATP-binding protein [Thermaurantimonas sp.]|uniref:ABC transporter ATP-binding protein n=1 Tax=Thermaurantimonas sp. TaxID=2681568 RepID=UPI00391CCBBC
MHLSASEKNWVIRAERVRKFYEFDDRSRLDALSDVSFTLPEGSSTALIGGNGSGKSTLLKLIAGILQPSEGRVITRGRVASLLDLGAGFHPELTGRENIFFYGRLQGLSEDEIRNLLPEIKAFADIGEFTERPLKYYSHGMYLRLAFATAIHMPFDILLIDEILAVGDAAFQQRSIERLRAVRSGGEKTLVVVSHQMNLLGQLCDQAIWLSKGKVVEMGPIDNVVTNYLQSEQTKTGYIKNGCITDVSCIWDREAATYITGEEANLILKIQTTQVITGLQIRINLFDANSTFITHLDAGFESDTLMSLKKGLNTIQIHIPRLTLFPGNYFCRVSMYANDQLLYRQMATAFFQVKNQDWLKMINAHTTLRTGVYLKHYFKINPES